MKKATVFIFVIAISLSLYFGVEKYDYNEDTAKRAAASAFSKMASEECNVDPEEVRIEVVTVTSPIDDSGKYYDVVADIYVRDRHGDMSAFISNTISIFGYVLNGTDVTGVGLNCS